MWFKLSVLLFLIFCSCNVSSKNLRKSLNQNGFGFTEDSLYPNAAPDFKFHDGYGEVQEKQHHGTIDDSSNLNNDDGNQNEREFDSNNFDKQYKDVLAEIQHNGYSGNKHERFRRGYYDWDTTTVSSVSGRTITVWGIGMIVLVIFLPLLFCCCIIGLISWAVYAVAKQNRHVQPGVVYQQ